MCCKVFRRLLEPEVKAESKRAWLCSLTPSVPIPRDRNVRQFGKYDDRIKHGGSQFTHAIEKTKHNLRLLSHYPEEVVWEPFFRLYHWIWRKLRLWRF